MGVCISEGYAPFQPYFSYTGLFAPLLILNGTHVTIRTILWSAKCITAQSILEDLRKLESLLWV